MFSLLPRDVYPRIFAVILCAKNQKMIYASYKWLLWTNCLNNLFSYNANVEKIRRRHD